jgi:hypothetical protein
MASVASQLIEEVTAHAQSDSLEDAREICADGTYLPNNLRIFGLGTNDGSMEWRVGAWFYIGKSVVRN